jgi:hypothetical protein
MKRSIAIAAVISFLLLVLGIFALKGERERQSGGSDLSAAFMEQFTEGNLDSSLAMLCSDARDPVILEKVYSMLESKYGKEFRAKRLSGRRFQFQSAGGRVRTRGWVYLPVRKTNHVWEVCPSGDLSTAEQLFGPDVLRLT